MARKAPIEKPYDDTEFDTLRELLPDWQRTLKARKTADTTIKSYLAVAGEFCDFLDAHEDFPKAPQGLKQMHVEEYLTHLQTRPSRRSTEEKPKMLSDATVAKHYRSLQQLFVWVEKTEDEVEHSPFEHMEPPKVEEKLVPIIKTENLIALFDSCSSKSFEDRRDLLLMHLFFDTGVRCGEMAGMRVDGINRDLGTINVIGKGNRERGVQYGDESEQYLRPYLRSRSQHQFRENEGLWLGRSGRLTESGIADIIERRCKAVGIEHINPHRFRHTWAHNFKADGGSDGNLMVLAGWRSAQMAARYGKSAEAERAQQYHRKNNAADRLAAERRATEPRRRGRKPGGN
jgi:site-specific recombinase XerD